MRLDVAIVRWMDAHSESDTWMPLETSPSDPLLVTTVGILLPRRSTKRRHLSIAQSVTDHGYVDSILHIPKQMVVSVEKLGKARVASGNEETNPV